LPRLPRRKDFRIGCLGAGFIMSDCHLVAYRQAGFEPVAIASRDADKAKAVAARHGVRKVYTTYQELLADPEIEVVDVAVPPDAQPDLIRAACQHRHVKGVLAQKPLAMTVAEARSCVEACAKAGVVLAVNQNMRYDQSIRAMKDLLNRGWIGEPVLATIDMRAVPHWMPWSQGQRSLSTFIMSIHHLDTFRYWFGTPGRVLASTRPDPRTKFAHADGINLYVLEYDNGIRACSWDDVWAGPCKEGVTGEVGIRWRVEGTEGLALGTIGWPSYPAKTPSTLDYSTARQPNTWISPRWNEVWFPDAFVGTMAQLLCAIEDGTEAEISGRDNLETIALCEAVLTAAREHRVTTVREFL
jgi:predicted dehydrogenase